MKKPTIRAADLFCGAGGTSTGLKAACSAMGLELDLVAVNHWPIAIASHEANHPYAEHCCAEIESINPRKLVPGGRLKLLVASPECTHHANARGGRPMNDQSRASAWHVLRWLELLYVENVLIENVKEFRSWGPLGANGRPLKSQRGETYAAFLNALRGLGYNVEDRVLNAADFGDPTTRERLFIIARRGNKNILWPQPTHAPAARLKKPNLFKQTLKPWVAAREIIDWSIPGQSIFNRKKPLAEKTLRRIYAGLKKFGGPAAEPWLIVLRNHMDARSVNEPLPTLSAGGNHVGLVEPLLLAHQRKQNLRPVSEPMATVTASSSDFALVEPFIVPNFGEREGQEPRSHSLEAPLPAVTGHGAGALVTPEAFLLPQHSGGDLRPVSKPVPTIATGGAISLIEPQAFLIGRGGPSGSGRPQSIDEPLNTVLTENHRAVVEPFITAFRGNHNGREDGNDRNHPLTNPLPTQDCSNRYGVVEADAFIVDVNHGLTNGKDGGRRAQSINEPIGTITAGRRGKGLAQPCVVKYFGTATAQSVEEPLHTVTAKDRYALVTTEHGTYALDIRLRMLRPHELAAAMSLKNYKLMGKMEDQVKQIGNAVPVRLAEALCRQVIA